MQLMMKRLLAVMDGEGRKLEAVFFEGEAVKLVDKRGQWHEGVIKRIHGTDIILEEADGTSRYLLFNNIDHIEKVKYETGGEAMAEAAEVDELGADDDLH